MFLWEYLRTAVSRRDKKGFTLIGVIGIMLTGEEEKRGKRSSRGRKKSATTQPCKGRGLRIRRSRSKYRVRSSR